jgi:hypothetical protein
MKQTSTFVVAPLGGLEPPSFRLTAERASQLRHRGLFTTLSHNINVLSEKNTILSDLWGKILLIPEANIHSYEYTEGFKFL